MGDIFLETEINQALSKDGYAVAPVLDEKEIEALKTLYASLPHTDSIGTYVTMFHPSFEYRQTVNNGIMKICASKIKSLVNGYRPLYANFMVKNKGPEGDFPVHQDWTYVDEEKFQSLAFWIPLDDVDEANGTLHVVPGSQTFLTHLRGPYVFEPYFHMSQKIRSKYSKAICLRAGEALIWDHRLIHFSLPNQKDSPRLVITIIMVPEGVPVVHCYALPESGGVEIEKFDVDTDFYLHYTISKRPENVSLVTKITQPVMTISEDQFDKMYRSLNPDQKK